MGNSKMNARERIDYLFDDHSFVEVGGYVSARNTDYNLGAKKVEGDGVDLDYRKRQMPFTLLERFLISRHRHLE